MYQSELLISVIVTAYNIERYLPRCLDSLIAQTYQRLEIIVVDDGSTDRTGQICDRYAAECPRISVIHKENGGPSAARNAGVKIAKGDYIGYVDGDDWVEPDMYEEMLRACTDLQVPVAICTYRQVGEGAEKIHPTGNVMLLDRNRALEVYICDQEQYHIYPSVWSKLFRRDIIENISFREGRKSEDIMYTTMALVQAESCAFLDTPYYNYMVDRQGSIMNERLHERRFQDEIPFWREQEGYLAEHGFTELADKSYYYFCKRMLYYFLDFKTRGMNESARRIAEMLTGEKKRIREIYRSSYVAKGDRARMALFLKSPEIYYDVVKLYDRVVIPMRSKA